MSDLPCGGLDTRESVTGRPLTEVGETVELPMNEEGQKGGVADSELLRKTRRLSLSEHHSMEVTRAPVRFATLPKIEVPERFAGTPGVGSSLKNYMMQTRNAQYRWMNDGLEPEYFFRGLSNTVTRDAKMAYGMELERMLSESAQASGTTCKVVMQFFTTLRRHFPCRDEWRLVTKFLGCLDERVASWPGRPSRQENPQAGGWDARQRRADATGAARRATCSGIAAGRRSVITATRKDICVENAQKSPAAGTAEGEGITRKIATVAARDLRAASAACEDSDDRPVGTLPVHFVKRELRGAFQARMAEMDEQLEDWLAAALKAGCKLKKWVLVELDPVVRRMAIHHAKKLRGIYPMQMMSEEEAELEEDMIHNVKEVALEDMRRWGRVDLLVVGWECQGVSRAGKGKGLEDTMSTLFLELLRVTKLIYQQHAEYLYILEDPDFSTNCREPVQRMQEVVTADLGQGVAWTQLSRGLTRTE
ncbi:unnamed protein product [Closterium sp. NIES-54]